MITLPFSVVRQIRHEAILSYPRECCGLLIGEENEETQRIRVVRAVASRNVSKQRQEDSFEIDPALHLAVQRKLRESAAGFKVVGVYHSHPNGLPLPSKVDIERAYEPQLAWFIMSINRNSEEEWGMFRLDSGASTAQPLACEVV